MKQFSRQLIFLLVLITASAMLVGCFNRDRQPVYVDSDEITPLRVPSDLSEPSRRSAYEVPGYFLPELAARGNEERPPRVLPSAEAERSRSHIRFGSTGLYLEVQDEPESVWRRLSFTLNRDGMRVRDADQTEGRYRFEFYHEPIVVERGFLRRTVLFWRGAEVTDFSGTYQVRVEPEDEDTTRVALLDSDGEILDMERAEFVLARLRERLG